MIKEESTINNLQHYIVEDQYTINHHGFSLATYVSISDILGNVCLYITKESIADIVLHPTYKKVDRLHSLGTERFFLIRDTISEVEDFVDRNNLRNKPDYFGVKPTVYMDDNFEKVYRSLLAQYKEDHKG